MPSDIPFRTNRWGAFARFFTEDVRNWLITPRKKPVVRQAREIVDLWRRYRFVPYQYFKHDLYASDIGDEYWTYVPSLFADRYVYDVNPKECIDWLEDKMQFETRMAAAGLPFVPTIALLSIEGGAFALSDRSGRSLNLQDLWALAREHAPNAVFIKPRLGLGGQGAFRLDIGAEGFERDGAPVTEACLRGRLAEAGFDDFLMQPYFEQHEALARLNPKSVNTLRVLTLNTDGRVDIISAYLRVGGGVSETDNSSDGGYSANACLTTGAIGARATIDLTYAKHRFVETHPVTGAAFGSITLPHPEAVVALVEQGARAFAPIRLIGWDIASGKHGPVAIEANAIPGFRTVQDICGGMRLTPYGRELAARYNWR